MNDARTTRASRISRGRASPTPRGDDARADVVRGRSRGRRDARCRDARARSIESNSIRSDGQRRVKRHVMGLHHASLRIVCVTCTRVFLFLFQSYTRAFLPVVYTFVSVSRYVLVSFARPPRRRAARAMATRWGTSGVRRADVDARRARSIDRSIDRFRLVSFRLGRVHRSKRSSARSSARSSPRARARDMTFKIFVGGARVDSNAVLSDAWNSSSVRALYSRAREARGERREARGAPNLGFLSNAHFWGVSLTRQTDRRRKSSSLCARRVDDRA